MKALLSIEWLKLRHYRTFYIIIGCFLLLCGLLIAFQRDFFVGGASMLLADTREFSAIWQNSAFYTSHVVIFLSLLLALLVTNEYQYRTHRQNVIDGWRRLDFYHAKWALAFSFALLATLSCLVAGLLYALFSDSNFALFTNGIINLLWIFLLTLNYMGLSLLLAVLIRRTGLTIIVILVYYMMIEPVLHMLMRYKMKWPAADLFLPMEVSDQLLSRPKLNHLPGGDAELFQSSVPIWLFALVTLCWIALYYFAGRRQLQRSDW